MSPFRQLFVELGEDVIAALKAPLVGAVMKAREPAVLRKLLLNSSECADVAAAFGFDEVVLAQREWDLSVEVTAVKGVRRRSVRITHVELYSDRSPVHAILAALDRIASEPPPHRHGEPMESSS